MVARWGDGLFGGFSQGKDDVVVKTERFACRYRFRNEAEYEQKNRHRHKGNQCNCSVFIKSV
jgi:hypothetical protein